MNFWKIVFWSMTILVGFVNPVISFGLVILYYFPGIVSSVCKECFNQYTHPENENQSKADHYSKDTLEEMK